MNLLLRALLIASPLVTACADNAAPVEGDFSCLGTQRTTVATDPMSASGQVLNELGGAPIVGAGVEIHAISDAALLGQADTGATGSYAVALATGGIAPTVYRQITAVGFLDAYAYDPAPMTAEPTLQALLTLVDTEQLYAAVGLAPDATRGTLLVTVVDCAGNTVRGATVSAAGAQRVAYLGDDTRFDPDATATSKDASALLFNVPAGPVELEIHAGDITYRAWPIESHADALTTSWRQP